MFSVFDDFVAVGLVFSRVGVDAVFAEVDGADDVVEVVEVVECVAGVLGSLVVNGEDFMEFLLHAGGDGEDAGFGVELFEGVGEEEHVFLDAGVAAPGLPEREADDQDSDDVLEAL